MARQNESSQFDAFSELGARQLRERVENMPNEELDMLPFGVIRLNAAGVVVYFSRGEAEQSGYGNRKAVGLKFFTELAPCMATPDFLRRIELAQAAGELDIGFQQVGDFDDADRALQVRAISGAGGGMWLFIRRPSRTAEA